VPTVKARARTAPHRPAPPPLDHETTLPPLHRAPPRTAPPRTAPHRTAPHLIHQAGLARAPLQPHERTASGPQATPLALPHADACSRTAPGGPDRSAPGGLGSAMVRPPRTDAPTTTDQAANTPADQPAHLPRTRAMGPVPDRGGGARGDEPSDFRFAGRFAISLCS
jgi:hypothetical protein